MRDERLIEWSGEPQPVFNDSNWVELHQCMVISLAWNGVFISNQELKDALQPNVCLSISFSEGLRVPQQSAWLEGHSPQVTIFGFYPTVTLQITRLLDNLSIIERSQSTNTPISVNFPSSGDYVVKATCAGEPTERLVKIVDWSWLGIEKPQRCEITPMVGVAHDVYEYTNNIPYQAVQELTCDNPFDLIESASINNSFIDIDISGRYEQLLYWLSALGGGTWESFKKGCEVLQLQEPKRILRRLRLLGHIESSLDGKRWSAAPPALVKINSQLNSQEFILCGQRCISWLTQLEEYAEIIPLCQPTGNAPPCIRLKVNERNRITQQFPIIDMGDVSSRLADILPDMTIWQQSLRSVPGIVPSLYEWMRFDGNDFVERTFQNETGMYQMWNREGSDFSRMTLFYEAETDTWRQGDWYGLRFLALHYSDRLLIAHYDSITARLAIPFSQRWPELYERALVLASGFVPIYHKTEQNLWLIYENIAPNLAEKLTKKLYINCDEGFSCA